MGMRGLLPLEPVARSATRQRLVETGTLDDGFGYYECVEHCICGTIRVDSVGGRDACLRPRFGLLKE